MFNLEDSDQFRYQLFYSGKLKPNVKYSVLLDFSPVIIDNNLKINNLNEARNKLSDSSFKTARIGFNYFGSKLFEINGIPLDIKLSDGILNINGLTNDFDKFKEKILLNYKSDTTVQEGD